MWKWLGEYVCSARGLGLMWTYKILCGLMGYIQVKTKHVILDITLNDFWVLFHIIPVIVKCFLDSCST